MASCAAAVRYAHAPRSTTALPACRILAQPLRARPRPTSHLDSCFGSFQVEVAPRVSLYFLLQHDSRSVSPPSSSRRRWLGRADSLRRLAIARLRPSPVRSRIKSRSSGPGGGICGSASRPSITVVPDDHLVRAIADVLDLSWVRAELAAAVLLEMPASRRTHGRSGPNQRPRSVAGAVPAAMPDRGQRPER